MELRLDLISSLTAENLSDARRPCCARMSFCTHALSYTDASDRGLEVGCWKLEVLQVRRLGNPLRKDAFRLRPHLPPGRRVRSAAGRLLLLAV